jgi:hypothetical protein
MSGGMRALLIRAVERRPHRRVWFVMIVIPFFAQVYDPFYHREGKAHRVFFGETRHVEIKVTF